MKNRKNKNKNLNVKLLHKIISVWLVIAVLLPMSLQFTHSFESHKQRDECKNINIQHLHKHQIDCEFKHCIFNSNASLTDVAFELKEPTLFLLSPFFFTLNSEEIQLFTKSSRAPPILLFS